MLEENRASAPGTAERPRELATEVLLLAHDTRNWLTAMQVYCDLLREARNNGEKWMNELSASIGRGEQLLASLLASVQAAGEAPEAGGSGGRHEDRAKEIHSVVPASLAAPPAAAVMDAPAAQIAPTVMDAPDRRWEAGSAAPVDPAIPPVDLPSAVRRRLPLLERLAGAGIYVELDAPPNAGKAVLPEIDFVRILDNLILNAIEAMPRGGRLRIALRRRKRAEGASSAASAGRRPGRAGGGARRDGDRRSPVEPARPMERGETDRSRAEEGMETVLLRIHDTGEGIAADRLRRIFEPGVSDKTADKTGGKLAEESGGASRFHGYGLASVRELVERAHGRVRVRSRPGRGSCFEVEFPRV